MNDQEKQTVWKTLSSKEMYKNPWIRVREDEIIHPNGKNGIYGVVEIPPGIFVIAIDEQSRILMIKQSHYPTHLQSWELPGGGLKPNMTHEEQALEELREEAGHSVEKIIEIATTQTQPGITTQLDHFMVARGLTEQNPKDLESVQMEEGITRVQFFSLQEVEELIMSGAISHGQSITGLYLYQIWKTKRTNNLPAS